MSHRLGHLGTFPAHDKLRTFLMENPAFQRFKCLPLVHEIAYPGNVQGEEAEIRTSVTSRTKILLQY